MATSPTGHTNRPSWTVRIGLTVVGVFLCFAVVVYSTMYFGMTSGEEFCPESFARRSFAYYEIPLIGIQVTPIQHKDKTGDLEQLLGDSKFLPQQQRPAGVAARWDLVLATRGSTVSHRGDAQILCNYFDALDANDQPVWLAWTKEHPELAQALWPAIADLAYRELYIFVPDLMELARRKPSASQLKQAIDRTLAVSFVELAQNQQVLARHEQAIELFSQALLRSPEEIEALEGRAESLRSIGKEQESAADLALVRKLKAR